MKNVSKNKLSEKQDRLAGKERTLVEHSVWGLHRSKFESQLPYLLATWM